MKKTRQTAVALLQSGAKQITLSRKQALALFDMQREKRNAETQRLRIALWRAESALRSVMGALDAAELRLLHAADKMEKARKEDV